MIEKPLTDWQRIGHLFAFVFLSLMFVGFVVFYLLFGDRLSVGLKMQALLTAIIGLCGAVYEMFILSKNKINLRKDKLIELIMVWVCTCLFIFFMFGYTALTGNPAEGALKMLYGYLVVIPAVLCTIVYYVREKTLDLKEHLLRMEMQMNEMQEKLFGDENGKDQ